MFDRFFIKSLLPRLDEHSFPVIAETHGLHARSSLQFPLQLVQLRPPMFRHGIHNVFHRQRCGRRPCQHQPQRHQDAAQHEHARVAPSLISPAAHHAAREQAQRLHGIVNPHRRTFQIGRCDFGYQRRHTRFQNIEADEIHHQRHANRPHRTQAEN